VRRAGLQGLRRAPCGDSAGLAVRGWRAIRTVDQLCTPHQQLYKLVHGLIPVARRRWQVADAPAGMCPRPGAQTGGRAHSHAGAHRIRRGAIMCLLRNVIAL